MRKDHSIGFYTFCLVFVLSIFSIGNWIERYQSIPLFLAFFSSFLAYLFLTQEKESPKLLFSIGILARVVLFFSLPSLSDDVYRFFWDGTLLKNGIHPFEELPVYYLDRNISGIDAQLFEQLNSPNYFSVYPPLNQLLFWLSVQLGDGWLTSANVIRSVLLLADIGSFILLRRLLVHYAKPTHLAFWYFLNPLIILEFVGNIHFEGLVVFFVLLGIYTFERNKNWLSATGFGLAIGTKLLPLIYLPFLLFKGVKHKNWWVSIAAGVIGCVTMLPMFNESFINGMQNSLDLYFRSFEFNASIYYIARAIGIWIYGYNNIALVGPLLSILSLLSIVIVSYIAAWKDWSLPKALLFILTIYLLFTTTVHPWYVLPLIAFGILSQYWYPIIWSFLIFLTYFGYEKTGFELPGWIVVVEYLIVVVWFYLESKSRKLKSDQ